MIGQLYHAEDLQDAQLLILRNPPRIDHVRVTDITLNVYLKDGRTIGAPLSWFPRLLHGIPAERNHYQLFGEDDTIYWPFLDEDIALARLLEGGRSTESQQSLQKWLTNRNNSSILLAAD